MKTQLIPQFTFDNQAAEAMKFYHTIFGGTLSLNTFGETNMDNSDEMKDRIIHSQLTSDDFSLMACDLHPKFCSDGYKFTSGDNVGISLVGTDKEKLTKYFNQLAEGGTIEMPLEKQFWGDIFGSCKDKFGINWMVNISDK